jgi:Icc-related predicted phosphoesterase
MGLSIVVMGDLHSEFGMIEKFKQAIRNLDHLPDYVLINGDFINVHHGEDTRLPEEQHLEFQSVLDAVKELQIPILYVPGNHDPASEFLVNNTDDSCQNIHKKWKRIGATVADVGGFDVFGFGGSIPGLYDQEGLAFPGYPFHSDQEYAREFWAAYCSRTRQLDEDESRPIIVLGHIGPKCGTTDDTSGTRLIETGSCLQREKLLQDQFAPILYLHGHSHYSFGMAQLKNSAIVNPGPLRDGRFACILLDQRIERVVLESL